MRLVRQATAVSLEKCRYTVQRNTASLRDVLRVAETGLKLSLLDTPQPPVVVCLARATWARRVAAIKERGAACHRSICC